MKIAILFGLFLIECTNMDNSITNVDTLLFENYYQNKVVFHEEYLISEEAGYITDSMLVDKERLLKVQTNKITGELFNTLCNLELINQWKIYNRSEMNIYSDRYEEFVERRSKDLELFYLGKLKISKNFNSFLILVSNTKNDNYNINKSVFLINVKDNKIVSITRMSSYICFDGQCDFIFTEISKKGVLIQKNKEVSSDVILPKEEKQNEEKIEVKFKFDSKGRIQIL